MPDPLDSPAPESPASPADSCAELNKQGEPCLMAQGLRIDPDDATRCMVHSQHPEAIARRRLNGEIGKLSGRLGGRPPQRRRDRELPPEAPREPVPPTEPLAVPEGLEGDLDIGTREGRERCIRACLQNLFSGAWSPHMVAAVSGALGTIARDVRPDPHTASAGLLERLIARHAGEDGVDD